MSPNNRTLSLRHGGESEVADPQTMILEALARRTCIMADYNRGAVILAPVLLFREHDALFLIAATVSRDGKPPREPKLGTFRLSGMTNVRRLRAAIDPALVPPDDWQAGRASREPVAALAPPLPPMAAE